VEVAETDVYNGSAQASLVMSSLRDVAHTFVNDFYTGNFYPNNSIQKLKIKIKNPIQNN